MPFSREHRPLKCESSTRASKPDANRGDRFAKVNALIGNSHALSATVLDTEDRGDIAGTLKSFDGEVLALADNDSTEVGWTNRVYAANYTYRSNVLPLVVHLTAGRSEMTNDFGPEGAPERTSAIESTDLAADVSWLLRNGSINAGATRRTSTFDLVLDDAFQDFTSNSVDLTEVTAWLDTELNFAGDKLSLNPGVHFYALTDRSRSWVDPRFRMSIYPTGVTGRHSFHAAFGVYHQAVVGLTDERDLGNVFTAWTTTPDDQDVPKSTHFIGGWNVRLGSWISAAAEGFYKKYDDLSVPIFSALPRFTTALQSANGSAYGVDVRVDLSDRPFVSESVLDGYISYAWSKVEYETDAFTYSPGHDRRHQLNALLHAQKNEIGITVQFQMGSGLPFTQSGGFDKWYLLTPDVDVTAEPGVDRIVYAEPFAGKQPMYARMDLWLEKKIESGRYVSTLRAGALNIFNRDNLFYYDLFTFRRVDQLPFIPSVGVKIELR